MNTIPTAPLFSAALPAPTDGGVEKDPQELDGGSRQSAWQREMERAQMQNWLRHPATEAKTHQQPDMRATAGLRETGRVNAAQTALITDASARGDATVIPAPVVKLPSLNTATQVQMASAVKSAAVTTGGHALGQDLLRQLRLNLNLPKLNEAGLEPYIVRDTQEMAQAAAPSGVTAEVTDQPLRIHAQWQGQDVQLWLGVDGKHQLLPAELAQIVHASQSWLASQGAKLLSVVCNGQTIYMAPGSSTAAESSAHELPAHTRRTQNAQQNCPSLAGQFPYSYFDFQEA